MKIALLLLISAAPAVDGPSCKGNPALSGACFTVHGRLRAYNGNPTFRIWPIGTKRLLGVTGAEPGQEPILPQDLACGFDCDVFADFLVCPFTQDQPGVVRRVCVESASNRAIKRIQ